MRSRDASNSSFSLVKSTSSRIVAPNPAYLQGDSSIINSLDTLDKRSIVNTYAEVLNSQQVIDSTLQLLNLNPTEFSAYTTAVTVLPDANIIRFSVQGPTLLRGVTHLDVSRDDIEKALTIVAKVLA